MHVSEAFLIMRKRHFNLLDGLKSVEQKKEARKIIVEMVLATDMSSHFKNLAELKNQIETHKVKNLPWSANSVNDRLVCLETALHCADLGNPAKPMRLYSQWIPRVLNEFYLQGDEEKRLGLPVSFGMDRTKPALEKGQLGFIDFIVLPLYQAFAQINTDIEQTAVAEAIKNKQHFTELIAKMAAASHAAAS